MKKLLSRITKAATHSELMLTWNIDWFHKKIWELNDCKHLLVIIEWLKKEVIIESIENIDVKTVIWVFFKKVYHHHKLSSKIVSDWEKAFINKFWKQVCQILEIIWWLLTTYHSEINNSIKYINQIIEAYFWMFVNYMQDNWAALLLSI